jgi:hypothetical protein
MAEIPYRGCRHGRNSAQCSAAKLGWTEKFVQLHNTICLAEHVNNEQTFCWIVCSVQLFRSILGLGAAILWYSDTPSTVKRYTPWGEQGRPQGKTARRKRDQDDYLAKLPRIFRKVTQHVEVLKQVDNLEAVSPIKLSPRQIKRREKTESRNNSEDLWRKRQVWCGAHIANDLRRPEDTTSSAWMP